MRNTDERSDRFRSIKWFDLPASELVEEIGLLSERELDSVPFGVICLTRDGYVLTCNAAESRSTRRRRSSVIGHDFFREIAPCSQTREFRGRFMTGALRGDLDESFFFTFSSLEGSPRVHVRMVSDRATGLIWMLMNPRTHVDSSSDSEYEIPTSMSERRAS